MVEDCGGRRSGVWASPRTRSPDPGYVCGDCSRMSKVYALPPPTHVKPMQGLSNYTEGVFPSRLGGPLQTGSSFPVTSALMWLTISHPGLLLPWLSSPPTIFSSWSFSWSFIRPFQSSTLVKPNRPPFPNCIWTMEPIVESTGPYSLETNLERK
jgi:hypothetical protein